MPNGKLTFSEELVGARDELEGRIFQPERVTAQAVAESFGQRSQLGAENIVAVGLGEKEVEGESTGEACVKIFVAEKLPRQHVAEQYFITPESIGVLTDVDEIGIPVMHRNPTKYRPAPGGSSISNVREHAAGTLGCLVRLGDGVAALTNNHVIARMNQGEAGEAIAQPGLLDGGDPADPTAELGPFVRIDFGPGGSNQADAALATIPYEWCESVLPFILGIGEVRGEIEPSVGLSVQKAGRTTGLTRGSIRAIRVTATIDYREAGFATFRNTVVVRSSQPGRPFSQPGDSGSLILTEENQACALLFAGGERATIGNPIGTVLAELRNVTGAGVWVELWTM